MYPTWSQRVLSSACSAASTAAPSVRAAISDQDLCMKGFVNEALEFPVSTEPSGCCSRSTMKPSFLVDESTELNTKILKPPTPNSTAKNSLLSSKLSKAKYEDHTCVPDLNAARLQQASEGLLSLLALAFSSAESSAAFLFCRLGVKEGLSCELAMESQSL